LEVEVESSQSGGPPGKRQIFYLKNKRTGVTPVVKSLPNMCKPCARPISGTGEYYSPCKNITRELKCLYYLIIINFN
jgi:hypothetical protein